MTDAELLMLTIAGFPTPRFTMQTNDYLSMSSGYSSAVSAAAWCSSFAQPLYNQPWQKMKVRFT